MNFKRLFKLIIYLSFFALNSQIKTTMVSFSGYVNGHYINTTGEIDYKFIFQGDPEVQASWKWFKVNYVNYKGVKYSSLNNRKYIKFPYSLTSSFTTNVELTSVPPTKSGFESITKNMYGKQIQNYSFTLDKGTWTKYSISERQKEKTSWLETPFINRATIISLSGAAINSIFNDIKRTLEEEKKDKEKQKKSKKEKEENSK